MSKRLIYVLLLSILCACNPFLRKDSSILKSNSPIHKRGTSVFLEPTNLDLTLSSTMPGSEAEHTLTFDVPQGNLETYWGVVTYPKVWKFNGFLALFNSVYECRPKIVFKEPFRTHISAPILGIDSDNAFIDINLNGSVDSIDPTLVHSIDGSGNHVFDLTMPLGGNGISGDITLASPVTITLNINSGVLTNPSSEGTFTVTGAFISVDPDTDDADNGTGDSPLTLNLSQDIVIATPIPAMGLGSMMILVALITLLFMGLVSRKRLLSPK